MAETTIRPKLSAKRAVRLTSPLISARLQIRANGRGKQESWTVATTTKPATKGSKQTSFRVRVSDVGYRVCLVYYDDQGKRREPYLCYLSASEWKEAKLHNLDNFARIVIEKLTARTAKKNANGQRLSDLLRQVSMLHDQKIIK